MYKKEAKESAQSDRKGPKHTVSKWPSMVGLISSETCDFLFVFSQEAFMP